MSTSPSSSAISPPSTMRSSSSAASSSSSGYMSCIAPLTATRSVASSISRVSGAARRWVFSAVVNRLPLAFACRRASSAALAVRARVRSSAWSARSSELDTIAP